jgi:excisionase family DNA binding protein
VADTYTVPQAAQILGLSERRVRQLVSQGKLPADRDTSGALLLSQAAVNNERKSRRKTNGSASGRKPAEARRNSAAPPAPAVDVDELASAVAAAVGKSLEGQLELTRRAETAVRQELDEERARSLQLEQRLAAAEAQAELMRQQLAEAKAPKKRRLFRKEA